MDADLDESAGEDKVGKIECAVCGEYLWYNTTGHQKTHAADQPQDYYAYKEYVAEISGLDPDHDVFSDDTVVSPNKWHEIEDRCAAIAIGLRLK